MCTSDTVSTFVHPTHTPATLACSDPRQTPQEVVELDKTISDLEERLSRLKVKRLQALADQALICRIPSEILSRIFELGTHENLHLLPTISLVSRYWRQLALSTPMLWSYVKLDHEWNYGRGADFIRKIKTYMQRSQSCKILVDLDFRYCESLAEARAMLDELQPHLNRCFSFRVSVPDWDWMGAVKEHSGAMRPNLEEVSLRIDPSDGEETAPVTVLTGLFPRLKSIILEQTPLACINAEVPALRRFYVIRDKRYHSSARIRVPLKELLATVTSALTLEDLRIQSAMFSLDGADSIFYGNPTLVSIPNLTDLSISFVDSTNVGLLLDSVSLPSLYRLAIQMESNTEDSMQWLSRMSLTCNEHLPSLRHLELRTCNVDGAALAPFVQALHHMPQLTALALCSPPTGNLGARLFDLMAGGPAVTGRWLLPNLQALCVQSCRDITGYELLRLLRARQGLMVPDVQDIRVLRIAPCYPLDVDIVDLLKQNVDTLQLI